MKFINFSGPDKYIQEVDARNENVDYKETLEKAFQDKKLSIVYREYNNYKQAITVNVFP